MEQYPFMRTLQPEEIEEIRLKLTSEIPLDRLRAIQPYTTRKIPFDIIEQCSRDSEWLVRELAFIACVWRDDVPLHFIRQGLSDIRKDVRQAALRACTMRDDFPWGIIREGLEDEHENVRRTALFVCYRHNPPQDIINSCLWDKSPLVREAAAELLAKTS